MSLLRPKPIRVYQLTAKSLIAPGWALTYIILLHNAGAKEVVADVRNSLPARLDYVPDSATQGGTYDQKTRTLHWHITVPGNSYVSLSFAARARTEDLLSTVINTATIVSSMFMKTNCLSIVNA